MRIKKSVTGYYKAKKYLAEGSLAGTAALTIGKLSGKTENDIVMDMDHLIKTMPPVKNTVELCDYLIGYYGMPEEYRSSLVMVWNEDNRLTPVVTLEMEVNGQMVLLPISEDGTYPKVMTVDNMIVEKIYPKEDNSETAN